MYGDAVFESIRVHPHLWLADAHFRRLRRSLSALGLPASALAEARAVADARPATEGPYALRLVVSRGAGAGLRPFRQAVIYATLRPVEPTDAPLSLRSAATPRPSGFLPWHAKHSNYLPSIFALVGAPPNSEVLWCDARRRVLEAGTGNIILLQRDELVTPASNDILAGTTRDALRARAKTVTYEQLLKADAVWVTSAINIARPVKRIDGHAIPTRKTLTAELHREYQKVACASPRST